MAHAQARRAITDIDLQVVSGNLPASRAVWPGILQQVRPMEIIWPITATPDNTAFSILFQGESYYHKVDIGLSDPQNAEQLLAYNPHHRQLWRQESALSAGLAPATKAYQPNYGSLGHRLVEELMSAVRYVKARKRGQNLTCWRFIRSKPDALLHLLYEQVHGWLRREEPLTTWDYKALDTLLGEQERLALLDKLDWSNPAAMDSNFYRLLAQIIDLLQEKAYTYHETIPAGIVESHLSFIQAELGVEILGPILEDQEKDDQ